MLLSESGGSGGGIGFGASLGGLARGLVARSDGNVHSVNSGGLRSMVMAKGMVHSSSSKATLASGGLARGLGSTGGLFGKVQSVDTGGLIGGASKSGPERSENST